MPFINGRWVDDEEARRMMMQQQMEGMISPAGSFGPSPVGPPTYTPQPDYGAWPGRIGVEPPTPPTPVPMPPPVMQTVENFAQPSGMLAPTSVNPLQAFAEPSFTQPLAALNRQATGGFQGAGLDPAAINAAMRPQVPQIEAPQAPQIQAPQAPQIQAPQVQAPQMQAPPPQMQAPQMEAPQMLPPMNIPGRMQAPGGPSISDIDPAIINAAMAPQTSSLNPFASQAFIAPDSPQDYINEGTVPPGISLDNQSNIFLDTQYKDPTTIGGYDKGPDAEWGLTNVGGIYGTEPVVGGDNGVTPGYNPGLDASIINESMQSQAMSSADINAMMSKAYTGTDSVFTGDEVDVAWSGLHPSFDYSAHGSAGAGISPLPSWAGIFTKAIPAVTGATALMDTIYAEQARQDVKDMEEATEVDTFASGGQLPQLPDFVEDIVDKQATRKQEETVSVAELNSMAVAAMDKAKKDRQDKIAAANATARASKRAVAKAAAAAKRASDRAAARAVAASAAQAKSARAKARAVLAAAAGSDRGGPSQRDINAAIEVLGQVDTFASGNPFAEAAADRASVGIDASGKYSGGGPS